MKKPHSVLQNIVYFTQLGLSIATPPVLCLMGAIWLQKRFTLGDWVLIAAIVLGFGAGVSNFIQFLKHMKKEQDKNK